MRKPKPGGEAPCRCFGWQLLLRSQQIATSINTRYAEMILAPALTATHGRSENHLLSPLNCREWFCFKSLNFGVIYFWAINNCNCNCTKVKNIGYIIVSLICFKLCKRRIHRFECNSNFAEIYNKVALSLGKRTEPGRSRWEGDFNVSLLNLNFDSN